MRNNNLPLILRYLHSLLILFSLVFASFEEARADVTALNLSQSTVSACQDYFTSEWANPLDMNDSGDVLYNLLPREVQQLTPFSYANGIFSTSTTGDDPYFRLLTWVDNFQGDPVAIPDDTTRFGVKHPLEFARQGYRNLSFRMYSSVDSSLQVLWDKHDGAFGITEPIATYAGWHTYSIDLATAAQGESPWTSGKVVGLRIDPARLETSIGAQIKLDWAQLTPLAASCPSLVANYSTTNSDLANIFIDDNLNPIDGVLQESGVLPEGNGSLALSTATLFPGSYNLYAVGSKDYATLNLSPWDMDSSGVDINRVYEMSSSNFSSGKFCGTPATSMGNFYLNLPKGTTIDANLFNKFTIKLEKQIGFGQLVLTYFSSGRPVGDVLINTNGDGIYTADLSSAPGWSGQISDLRIIPVFNEQVPFCVDWVSVGSIYRAAEPSISSIFTASSNPVVSERPVVTFVQPDREGGEDFFVAVRGKPSNMSSTADIQRAENLSEAFIYPGNAYTDSAGNTRVGDFFYATSKQGSDDPINFSVFLDNSRTIDPDKYKIACFTLDVLKPTNVYHSVARILWQKDSINVNGDDLVLKTSGESRYCLRMDNLQTEPYFEPVQHPWKRNSDGSGINYWRIDAHEESDATSFRFQDIRLAADHLADDRFLVVVSGSRDRNVNLYYSGRGDGTQGTFIGTLAAGRNTDTFLWNTSAIAAGTWFLYLTVGSETYLAPSPVVVRHQGAIDTQGPFLGVDAPLSNHQFSDSLEISGYAVDNLKIATIEAFIDGNLFASFRPSQFRQSVRDNYRSLPYSSDSGFQQFISVPDSVGLGTHTLRLKAYDTAGNITQFESQIVRVATGSTTPISYPIPNEQRQAVSIEQPLPAPTSPPQAPRSLSLKTKISGVNISFEVSNANRCGNVQILGNISANKDRSKIENKSPTIIFTGTPNAQGRIKALAKNLKFIRLVKKKTDTNIYLLARCDGSRKSSIVKTDVKKIKKSKLGEIASTRAFLKLLRSKTKKI